MQFSSPLISATLIKRYKRFLADVRLDSGEEITVHCPNTGAMTGCADPGFTVWLSKSDNPKRKYSYTWELSQNQSGQWIGVNAAGANTIVSEALTNKAVEELTSYESWQQEVRYGEENSRIDFLLQDNQQARCYLEVKSVTLVQDGIGGFPDAVTLRGQKHLRELTTLAQQGKQASLLYLVQHTGVQKLDLNSSIDPEYARLLKQAQQSGVRILCYGCLINAEKIELKQTLKFLL